MQLRVNTWYVYVFPIRFNDSHLYMTKSIKWEDDGEYTISSVVYGRGRRLF